MGHKARILLLLSSVVSVSVFLFYIAFHNVYLRGMQAEAKLMISHLHTLQRIYKFENKRYQYWLEPYGAGREGADHCEQPEAAAEVGFTIPGCHRERAPLPRYGFRVVKDAMDDRYRIEAISGSDSRGQSFICFDGEGQDVWQSSHNLEFTQTESCW